MPWELNLNTWGWEASFLTTPPRLHLILVSINNVSLPQAGVEIDDIWHQRMLSAGMLCTLSLGLVPSYPCLPQKGTKSVGVWKLPKKNLLQPMAAWKSRCKPTAVAEDDIVVPCSYFVIALHLVPSSAVFPLIKHQVYAKTLLGWHHHRINFVHYVK